MSRKQRQDWRVRRPEFRRWRKDASRGYESEDADDDSDSEISGPVLSHRRPKNSTPSGRFDFPKPWQTSIEKADSNWNFDSFSHDTERNRAKTQPGQPGWTAGTQAKTQPWQQSGTAVTQARQQSCQENCDGGLASILLQMAKRKDYASLLVLASSILDIQSASHTVSPALLRIAQEAKSIAEKRGLSTDNLRAVLKQANKEATTGEARKKKANKVVEGEFGKYIKHSEDLVDLVRSGGGTASQVEEVRRRFGLTSTSLTEFEKLEKENDTLLLRALKVAENDEASTITTATAAIETAQQEGNVEDACQNYLGISSGVFNVIRSSTSSVQEAVRWLLTKDWTKPWLAVWGFKIVVVLACVVWKAKPALKLITQVVASVYSGGAYNVAQTLVQFFLSTVTQVALTLIKSVRDVELNFGFLSKLTFFGVGFLSTELNGLFRSLSFFYGAFQLVKDATLLMQEGKEALCSKYGISSLLASQTANSLEQLVKKFVQGVCNAVIKVASSMPTVSVPNLERLCESLSDMIAAFFRDKVLRASSSAPDENPPQQPHGWSSWDAGNVSFSPWSNPADDAVPFSIQINPTAVNAI
jgi:hypothetical protein